MPPNDLKLIALSALIALGGVSAMPLPPRKLAAVAAKNPILPAPPAFHGVYIEASGSTWCFVSETFESCGYTSGTLALSALVEHMDKPPTEPPTVTPPTEPPTETPTEPPSVTPPAPTDTPTETPTTTPTAPPPTSTIPSTGIAILDGNAAGKPTLFCVWPGDDQVTSSTQVEGAPQMDRPRIAAQCCSGPGTSNNVCKRRITNNNDCIAGLSTGAGTITEMTYQQTVDKCDSLGLQLCEHSCRGQGCAYNSHAVWSKLPCPWASGATAP